MGKVVGLVGSASGKVGNVVYAVMNGTQTVRVYQPNVANPKSELQQNQRLKMVLGGRLSKILPREALMGFEGNARMRRAKFVSNVVKSSNVTTSGGVKTAKVTLGNILFSEGSLDLHSANQTVTAARAVNNPNVIDVTFAQTALGVLTPAGYGESIVVLLIDAETSEFDYALVGDRNFASATTMSIRVADATREYIVAAYLVPRAIDTYTVKMGSSYLGADATGVKVDDAVIDKNIYYYGRSVMVGEVTVAPNA